MEFFFSCSSSMRSICTCLLLLLATVRAWDRPKADLVKSLPGFDDRMGFEMYSGYLEGAVPNYQLHYVFVEAETSPHTAPLVLWLNGGPGCSSLMGMFTENGPFLITSGGRLVRNAYAWNKLANVVYLEAPAGVGFSFARDGNVTTDDDMVANNNFNALEHFFRKFPEFMGRDFYIIGESYGGVYVPTLALLVAKHPDMNLKGIAIDNGLTSYELNDNSLIYFANYHSLIDASLWADLVDFCCGGKLIGRCLFTRNKDPRCQHSIEQVSKIVNYGLNIYNLYSPCAGGVPDNITSRAVKVEEPLISNVFSWRFVSERLSGIYKKYLQRFFGRLFEGMEAPKSRRAGGISSDRVAKSSLFITSSRSSRPQPLAGRLVIDCSDDTTQSDYFNSAAVRAALHIPAEVHEWNECDADVYGHYKRVYYDLASQYKSLIALNIRTHIFNGDVDMACNAIGDEWFVNGLGFPLIVPRHPWFYNATDGTRQIGGYTKTFVANATGTRLIFSTVRGAGHMVPMDKPDAAFRLYHAFLVDSHDF